MKLHIQNIPRIVYKIPTRFVRYKGGEEEFSFWFQVTGGEGRRVRQLKGILRLYSGRTRVEEILTPPSFWTSRILSREVVGRPGLYFLRFQTPCAAGVDKLTINLEILAEEKLERRLTIPLCRYRPKPLLQIPIEGGAYCFADHNTRHGAEAGWFALDLLGLGPENRLCSREPPRAPSDYHGLGRKLLSPAAGVVVRTCDGIPDREKLGDPAARQEKVNLWQRRDWHLFGNHIVICHGRTCYSLLAHVARGSVEVDPGNSVEAGQVIGRLGNSGLSRLPHLHFQLMTTADAFSAGPLPACFGPVRIPPFGRFKEVILPAGIVALPQTASAENA